MPRIPERSRSGVRGGPKTPYVGQPTRLISILCTCACAALFIYVIGEVIVHAYSDYQTAAPVLALFSAAGFYAAAYVVHVGHGFDRIAGVPGMRRTMHKRWRVTLTWAGRTLTRFLSARRSLGVGSLLIAASVLLPVGVGACGDPARGVDMLREKPIHLVAGGGMRKQVRCGDRLDFWQAEDPVWVSAAAACQSQSAEAFPLFRTLGRYVYGLSLVMSAIAFLGALFDAVRRRGSWLLEWPEWLRYAMWLTSCALTIFVVVDAQFAILYLYVRTAPHLWICEIVLACTGIAWCTWFPFAHRAGVLNALRRVAPRLVALALPPVVYTVVFLYSVTAPVVTGAHTALRGALWGLVTLYSGLAALTLGFGWLAIGPGARPRQGREAGADQHKHQGPAAVGQAVADVWQDDLEEAH